MNTKHTPGPWRVGDAGRTVFGRNEGAVSPVTVATLPAVAHPSRIDERRANARLIASSPRLLAALERLARDYAALLDSYQKSCEQMEQVTGDHVSDPLADTSYTDALQAIKEAKGLAR